MAAFVFYLFATFLVVSGLMVVLCRNPVHAVLFLILAFFNAAALFLFLNAEFLSMMLVIVYVGAVAVLFLFVVMMLDVRSQTLKGLFLFSNFKTWLKSLATALSYGLIFFVGTLLLTYGLSIALSYTLIHLAGALEGLGVDLYDDSPWESFITKLDSLQESSHYAFFLLQDGLPRPAVFSLFSGNITLEAVGSLLIIMLSILLAHTFSNRVIERLFAIRFGGLLFSPPVLILMSVSLLVLLGYGAGTWESSSLASSLILEPLPHRPGVTNTAALGRILYTHYVLIFQMAGVLLLIAMMGAIVLTLRKREGVRRQDVRSQISRSKDNSLMICKPSVGEGVKL